MRSSATFPYDRSDPARSGGEEARSMSSRPTLTIDHVELFVPDRAEAARWYARVLGLTILGQYEDWATNPSGPLMISSDGGGTKLALFEGEPQGRRETAGFHRVAFRIGADAFAAFLRRLPESGLVDQDGRPVVAESLRDHQRAFSLYFSDPYGHRLELTTYEYDALRRALREGEGHNPG